MFIPKQVVEYFYRECSSKYRSFLGEHVWNVIKSLQDLKLTRCYYSPFRNPYLQFNRWLYACKSNLQHLDVDENLLQDCVENCIPKFIIERYPFLYDIWASNYKGEVLSDDFKQRDAAALLLNSLNFLQDKFVDVAKVTENDISLRKFKDYFKLYRGNSQKDSESLVAYRCRLVCFNASNLPDRHPD